MSCLRNRGGLQRNPSERPTVVGHTPARGSPGDQNRWLVTTVLTNCQQFPEAAVPTQWVRASCYVRTGSGFSVPNLVRSCLLYPGQPTCKERPGLSTKLIPQGIKSYI